MSCLKLVFGGPNIVFGGWMICGLTFNYTCYKRFTGGGGINKITVNFGKDSIKEEYEFLSVGFSYESTFLNPNSTVD